MAIIDPTGHQVSLDAYLEPPVDDDVPEEAYCKVCEGSGVVGPATDLASPPCKACNGTGLSAAYQEACEVLDRAEQAAYEAYLEAMAAERGDVG